jgi:hypothetical protein
VRALAYLVAEGAPIETSPELLLDANIMKYGAEAVMGRPLGHNEILCMNTARTILSAYADRKSCEDWVKWAQEHPEQNRILNHAMRLVHG